MVAPIQSDYSNRKGIYKDLYREICLDNKKKELSNTRKPNKGIYVDLYKQIGFKNDENNENPNDLCSIAFKKLVEDIFSKASYLFSSVTNELKPLIVACMVAKKPINSYIESNLQDTTSQRHPELV